MARPPRHHPASPSRVRAPATRARGRTRRRADPASGAPTPSVLRLDLAGVTRPVILADADDLWPQFAAVCRGWPMTATRIGPADPAGPALSVMLGTPDAAEGPRYTHHSTCLVQPLTGLAPASAVCSLVADVVQDLVEARPDWLSLHCGAVLSGGRAIALTGPARAGKSTLVARLSAEPDLTVICDDVLPVAPDGRVLALGVGPRLRLPLPPGASDRFRDHVAATLVLSDGRYGYLMPPTLHPHGPAAPLGAVVILDRRDSGPASLHPVDPTDAVAFLLARSMSPGTLDALLDRTAALVRGAVCLRLRYADLEDAVALIGAAFPATGAWPAVATPPAVDDPAPPGPGSSDADLPQAPLEAPWRATPNVAARPVGDALFLCLPGDTDIVRLNVTGAAVWHLLSDPDP
ncbi:MAG: hypothetical protein MUF73_09120, partial [Rhodobacteraceae bacterium]|nr:hypothetical protein [Paracoccaceae bacterium]